MGGRKKCIKIPFLKWHYLLWHFTLVTHIHIYMTSNIFMLSELPKNVINPELPHTKKNVLILDFSTLFFLPHHHVIPLHENDVSTLIGRRRLEVRSIGNRSFIFMDICHCLCGWHMPNYTSSANTLRHNKSDRYSILEDCQEEAWTTENGE